ncbi:hypothetical protein A2917_03455 [Candidatus Nomurabacteria bacterium RIFCSPLOWO2_01_FULL_42_17]|uniref:Uncharacterized protein n=1 Tax=Candidatus Nomurabacteria bacterium RIFCSPLOWO2_01_FULL_42_17 TaxID=1801780 RepID=A0A1F6XNA6_9BACT|nr:MAG: hypothetical protein A2917_03455 [Candidatus Nomurabacteria bacterium RIFCSPLOWO2_01_FULL_42_17]
MTEINFGFSEVINIILTLILSFQWFQDRARENAVKNGLFAIREMVERTNVQSSPDILVALDSNLATLGVRRPYVERCKKLLSTIHLKLARSKNAPFPEPSFIKKEELARDKITTL